MTLQKQWGEREIKRSLRRNDERVEGQRHSDLRQLQQSRGPTLLRHSHYVMYKQIQSLHMVHRRRLITLPTRPHSPATTLVHSSGLPDQPPINRRNYPSPSYGSFVIYPLSMCPPQVSTCYGCSAPLKPAGQIAPPPGDLVIVSNMLRSFTQNNMEYRKPSNVYFHCNTKCVQARQPYFLGVLCQIPFEVLNCISDQHRAYLRMNLGLSV